MVKVLIATGGTGGHIFPAIALGKFLKNNNLEVVFTGRKESVEERLITEEGLRFLTIDSKKFKGENFIKKTFFMFKLLFAIISGYKILYKENVHYVVGTGGYVAAPLVFAGIIKGIKTGICEQNAYMGFGNRILSFFVNDIYLNFQNTVNVPMKYKSLVTGNFIRNEFNNKKREKGILVFGGSQGAVTINRIFTDILYDLKKMEGIKIFHITGEKDYENVKKIYQERGEGLIYEIYPFSNEIYKIFEKIDLVISRAGATSISEIYYCNKKAILIPYKYAADNHQWYNSVEFCKSGKGVILKENNLKKENLLKWIRFFINNEQRFQSDYNVLGDREKGKEIILKRIIGN